MSPMKFPWGARAPQLSPLVLSAMLATSVLAVPFSTLAQTPAAPAAMSIRQHPSHRAMKQETVEQRIAMLHFALKITRAEEPQWTPVAEAMRENEAAMQKLIVETTAKPHPLSAVDDLRTYERFTQAHAGGLKNLISSFDTLYQAMPDSQKATADQVFQKFGVRGAGHAS